MSEAKDKSIRVSRVLKMFDKCGGSGEYTKPFLEFTDFVQSELSSQVKIEENEIPILASFRHSDSWVVLTSDRLVWREGQTQNVLAWGEIRNATIPESALASVKSTANLSNALLVVSTNSGTVEILMEGGKPFLGFWNVLKMVPSLS